MFRKVANSCHALLQMKAVSPAIGVQTPNAMSTFELPCPLQIPVTCYRSWQACGYPAVLGELAVCDNRGGNKPRLGFSFVLK